MLFIPYFLEIMKQVQIEQQVLTSRSGENLCNRKIDFCFKHNMGLGFNYI